MFDRIVSIVRKRFEERNLSYEVVGGIDSRNAQPQGPGGSNRVAFVPIAEGAFTPPMFIGEGDPDEAGDVARQLFTAPIGFEVCCASYDAAHPDDQVAAMASCLVMFQAVAQEVHKAYAGQYGWDGFRWDNERKQGRFGSEFIARLVMNVPIFDLPSVERSPALSLRDPEEKR